MTHFDPPAHLSPRAAALWLAVVPSRARSPGRLAMVQAALEALDRADLARLAIAAEGMTTTTRTTGAVHLHPLLRVEREARAQFLTAWDRLGFAQDPREPTTIEQVMAALNPQFVPPPDSDDDDLDDDDSDLEGTDDE